MSTDLNPKKALIFRITHRDNIPWIFANGLHCRNSGVVDPNFVTIGNPELIDKRRYRGVPIPPGGTLSDYVPFYFTPFSPMMYNIKTGHGGIPPRKNDEIVIIVASLSKLQAEEVQFVYTDRHAYLQAAEFSSSVTDLDRIDWTILRNRDFRRDPDDLAKVERYQAEALPYRHVPVNSLLGIACYDSKTTGDIETLATGQGLPLKIVAQPTWYFR